MSLLLFENQGDANCGRKGLIEGGGSRADWVCLSCLCVENQEAPHGPWSVSVLPSLSSQPLSRCRSTRGPTRWPALSPAALGSGLVSPSRRSFHARCACKSKRATTRRLQHTCTHARRGEMCEGAAEEALFYVSPACMQDTVKPRPRSEKAVDILLPKLHHCTGEVGVVYDGVVCVAFLCVPWIVA